MRKLFISLAAVAIAGRAVAAARPSSGRPRPTSRPSSGTRRPLPRIRLTGQGQKVQAIVATAARQAERTAAELLGEHRLADLRRNLTDLVALLDSAGQPHGRQPGA